MTEDLAANIVANTIPTSGPKAALIEVESHRAIQEVQAAMIIAKRFPRDQKAAVDRILQAFSRPKLAEAALYSYSRGGTEITGPSIRAAETIAQQWGNLQFGVRELEQRNGESTVEAFAWDVETNTRQVKVFQVPHVRYRRPEKGGSVKLDDPRDIYEMVANQGARRLRACILGVIPGDVIEDAVNQAEVTMRTKVQVTPEILQSMLDKFAGFGISKEMIEKRIQRRYDAMTPALIVNLGKVYNSLRDGMSSAAEWFDVPKAEGDTAGGKGPDKGVAAFMNKTKIEAELAAEVPPKHLAPPPGFVETYSSGSDGRVANALLNAQTALGGKGQPTQQSDKPGTLTPSLDDALKAIKAKDYDLAADLSRGMVEKDAQFIRDEIAAAAKKSK